MLIVILMSLPPAVRAVPTAPEAQAQLIKRVFLSITSCKTFRDVVAVARRGLAPDEAKILESHLRRDLFKALPQMALTSANVITLKSRGRTGTWEAVDVSQGDYKINGAAIHVNSLVPIDGWLQRIKEISEDKYSLFSLFPNAYADGDDIESGQVGLGGMLAAVSKSTVELWAWVNRNANYQNSITCDELARDMKPCQISLDKKSLEKDFDETRASAREKEEGFAQNVRDLKFQLRRFQGKLKDQEFMSKIRQNCPGREKSAHECTQQIDLAIASFEPSSSERMESTAGRATQ